MVTLEQTVRPHPDVVDTELDTHETVLLHLRKKLYYSLNPTGSRIWQALKLQLTLQQISQRLQGEFAVDAESANRSVLALVDELCRHELAQSIDPEKSAAQSD